MAEGETLTVQADGSIGLASRVLRDALVRPVVLLLDVRDRQLHMRFVRRRSDAVLRLVLLALVDHVPVLPGPVVEGGWVRFREAFQSDAVAEGRADQLVRDPQHWRD